MGTPGKPRSALDCVSADSSDEEAAEPHAAVATNPNSAAN
jgi:hypothetical protein